MDRYEEQAAIRQRMMVDGQALHVCTGKGKP